VAEGEPLIDTPTRGRIPAGEVSKCDGWEAWEKRCDWLNESLEREHINACVLDPKHTGRCQIRHDDRLPPAGLVQDRLEADAQAVTRATLRALGYDPESHDLFDVRGRFPGVRITKQGKPLTFMRERDFLARLADPDIRIAFQAFVDDERRRARDTTAA